MKILIVNPHMKVGGIASSLVNWLYYIKENTPHQVELLVFDDEFDDKYLDIKDNFEVTILKRFKYLRLDHRRLKEFGIFAILLYSFIYLLRRCGLSDFFFKIIFQNYKYNKQYDIAISYSNDMPGRRDNVLANDFVEYSVNAKVKVAWIHNDIDRLGFTRKYALKRFKNFDWIVNVAESCRDQLDALVPEYQIKSLVVSNPVNLREIKHKVNDKIAIESSDFIFVTVARISPQKRMDRIIQVAKMLNARSIDFKWYVLGGGEDLERLKKETDSLGIGTKLTFLGFVNNPYPYLLKADYFVLTSDYEAQPVAVLEALSLSIPVITTDIPIMHNIIKSGTNGFIVAKDVNSIFNIMKTVIQKGTRLKGFNFIYDKYKLEFENLIKKIDSKYVS